MRDESGVEGGWVLAVGDDELAVGCDEEAGRAERAETGGRAVAGLVSSLAMELCPNRLLPEKGSC